jgi:hypothetical protein
MVAIASETPTFHRNYLAMNTADVTGGLGDGGTGQDRRLIAVYLRWG